MRTLVEELEQAFVEIEQQINGLVESNDFEVLYRKDAESGKSAIEILVRSAGNFEQCFGGLTSRLWDDPFEWTLPEELNTKAAVLEYLAETVEARIRGFKFLVSDEDLSKKLAAPEELVTVFSVLIRAFSSAASNLALAKYILRDSPDSAARQ